MAKEKIDKRIWLKKAVESKNWDLLDYLLEQDRSFINYNSFFTDTWGEWWGLLIECCRVGSADGVRVLLKHRASKKVESWGDAYPYRTPFSAAEGNSEILNLLYGKTKAKYTRKTDPNLPELTKRDKAAGRQYSTADETGLMFQPEAFEED